MAQPWTEDRYARRLQQGVEKKIFFKSGRVISSASNDPREYLGQFLMSHGYLTEPELTKAMEVQRQSGMLLGKILVMIEVIGEEELVRLMRLKAEEEIYDIFLWTEGEFQFLDDELPKQELIPLKVDVTGIIMEGTRRVDEWMRIREVIPNEVVVPVLEKPIPEDVDLEEVQEPVVRAIDGKRSIADIVLESRSSAFRVSETLCRAGARGLRPLRRSDRGESGGAGGGGRGRLHRRSPPGRRKRTRSCRCSTARSRRSAAAISRKRSGCCAPRRTSIRITRRCGRR
jgi:hypothetical protein